jgi:hypothetical protein
VFHERERERERKECVTPISSSLHIVSQLQLLLLTFLLVFVVQATNVRVRQTLISSSSVDDILVTVLVSL